MIFSITLSGLVRLKVHSNGRATVHDSFLPRGAIEEPAVVECKHELILAALSNRYRAPPSRRAKLLARW